MRNKLLVLFLATWIAFPAFSAWQLDSQHSALSFVTIKKGDIAEAHKFKQLFGSLDNQGKVDFTIDLTSVDTKIAIRDQRIKEFLFNTDLFPKAHFSAQLDMTTFNNIAVGSSKMIALTGNINLHGQQQKVNTEVLVAKLSNKQFIVSSIQPVLLNANGFSLVSGVKKLQKLAGLPSISNAVPVNFLLTFTQ